jgi:hypothetical protein
MFFLKSTDPPINVRGRGSPPAGKNPIRFRMAFAVVAPSSQGFHTALPFVPGQRRSITRPFDQAIHSFAHGGGLLRRACHRARIRATRPLAITIVASKPRRISPSGPAAVFATSCAALFALSRSGRLPTSAIVFSAAASWFPLRSSASCAIVWPLSNRARQAARSSGRRMSVCVSASWITRGRRVGSMGPVRRGRAQL